LAIEKPLKNVKMGLMMENFTMIMKPPTSGASNRRNCLGRGT
jgi:hypothetical protein